MVFPPDQKWLKLDIGLRILLFLLKPQKPKLKTTLKKPNHPSPSLPSHPKNQENSNNTKMAEKPQPVKVLYCGVCGLPAEYCEFGPDFEKCKPWLIRNAPDIYPDLIKDVKDAESVTEQLQGASISDKASVPGSSKPEEVKRLPGGKIKKKEKPEVIIEKVTRNRRKSITTVKGLELFGVKLSDASKKLGKKFATGASVVKGPTEKEQIDVQGDISFDVVDFITETWPDVI
ncbi:hypothetical protein AgCh_027192 [Apium graveolens]